MSGANLTIDDAAGDIIFSDNWATQLSDDPSTDLFFSNTYHAVQADGATANITFTGRAIYLFGSKGPGHANYSVRFDSRVIILSANASETMYQQPLFGLRFNDSGSHFVSLEARFVDDARWLDLDYITITVNDTTGGSSAPSPNDNSGVGMTISPPWLMSSFTATSSSQSPTTAGGAPTSPSSEPTAQSSTNSNPKTTLVLSILFGSIIGITLILLGLFLCCRRHNAVQRKREHAFRYGEALRHQAALSQQQHMLQADGAPQVTTPATIVVPEIYTAPDHPIKMTLPPASGHKHVLSQTHTHSSENVSAADPFARDQLTMTMLGPVMVGRRSDGTGKDGDVDRDRDRPRPRSPWSMLSNAATTILTARSGSPMSEATQTRLLRANSVQPIASSSLTHSSSPALDTYAHRRNNSEPLSVVDVRDHDAPAATPGPISNPRPLPVPPSHPLRAGVSATFPPPTVPPVIPLPAPPINHPPPPPFPPPPFAPKPRRPKRPREGLLDWLGSGIGDVRVWERRRDRDDGNSSRTDFLKV